MVLFCDQSCLTLCEPMDCSTPSFPVFHYLLEFAQTHVYWVNAVIQSSHPLSPTSLALSLSHIRVFSKEEKLFPSGGQSTGASAAGSVLPIYIQDWFPLEKAGLNSLQSKGLSRVFSSIIVQKHLSFGAQPSLWSNSHIRMWLLEKPDLCQQSDVSAFQHSVFLTFVIAFLPRSSCLLIS